MKLEELTICDEKEGNPATKSSSTLYNQGECSGCSFLKTDTTFICAVDNKSWRLLMTSLEIIVGNYRLTAQKDGSFEQVLKSSLCHRTTVLLFQRHDNQHLRLKNMLCSPLFASFADYKHHDFSATDSIGILGIFSLRKGASTISAWYFLWLSSEFPLKTPT